jgi:hypothetical protein
LILKKLSLLGALIAVNEEGVKSVALHWLYYQGVGWYEEVHLLVNWVVLHTDSNLKSLFQVLRWLFECPNTKKV